VKIPPVKMTSQKGGVGEILARRYSPAIIHGSEIFTDTFGWGKVSAVKRPGEKTFRRKTWPLIQVSLFVIFLLCNVFLINI
jgi:hypothetical protein